MAKDTETITPEVVPSSPADRTRAYRIRRVLKRDGEIPVEDAEWLRAYEAAQATNKGASKMHEVSYTEESAEAVGTGDAAAHAAAMAAPLLAKEEGRRIDNLIMAVIQATTAANKNTQAAYDMVIRTNQQLLERNHQLETVHLGMLEAIRSGHLDLTAAQAELIRKEAEAEGADGDGIMSMVKEMLPLLIQEIQSRKLGSGKSKG